MYVVLSLFFSLIMVNFYHSLEQVKSAEDSILSDALQMPVVNRMQIQSQAVTFDEGLDPFTQTDNQLAQRSSSITSDDILLENQVFASQVLASKGTRTSLRDSSISEDQEVLLELNMEEQEQFEVLDSAVGEDDKSLGITSSALVHCSSLCMNVGDDNSKLEQDTKGSIKSGGLSPTTSTTSSNGTVICS